MFVVPSTRLCVDGLAHANKEAQAAKVVFFDMVSAKVSQKTDGGGHRVKLREFVFFDYLPIAGWGIRGLYTIHRDII